jgi:uncharacterized protein (DUF3820 family)
MTYEKFPFGKYKGWLIQDMPMNYIIYALETFDLPDELVVELKKQVFERLNLEDVGIDVSWVKEVYRQLSKRYHPDAGGTKEAMQAINEFRDALL